MEAARRRVHRILALANAQALRQACAAICDATPAAMLRGPETGMVMARGRIGGSGAAFNIGDVSLTRASVRLANGAIGHAAHLGRDAGRVRLAAIVDALWQDPERRREIEDRIVAPLERFVEARDAKLGGEVAATKVDFFTLVRGED
ncbi:MAG: phosphonate C-P lyase system protein PhnG [Phyllobacteriaceae bacterium]|nr:phosphonate C-P lyase system protein PhnG [Phyllobacteriaceae bacterium]